MIAVDGLGKTYSGTSFAVQGVSFRVAKGEVVGFLGPNGAGKTTTLRIVAGFLGATAGKVTLDGHDIIDDPLKARAAIGYMPEGLPLYPEMRVGEYLSFRAELKGVRRAQRRDAVAQALRKAGAREMAATLIGHLSKGYRQRVGLAQAIIHNPPVLVLDEPTIGLDPRQIHEIRGLIHGLSGQHTIVLSTHILPEVSQICDRVVIINAGRVVLEESLGSLPAGKSLEDVFLEAISKEEGHEVAEPEETLEEVGAGHG